MEPVAQAVFGVGRATTDIRQIGLAATVVRSIKSARKQIGVSRSPAVVKRLNVGVATEIPVEQAVRLIATVLATAGRISVAVPQRARQPAPLSSSLDAKSVLETRSVSVSARPTVSRPSVGTSCAAEFSPAIISVALAVASRE